MPRLRALLLSLLLLPVPLVAQQVVPLCRPSSPVRLDTAVTMLGLRVVNSTDSLLDLDATIAIGAAVRDRFVAPPTFSRIFYPGTSFSAANSSDGVDPRRVRHAAIEIEIDSAGGLVRLAPRLVSADPATDSLLMTALRDASAAGALRRASAGAARLLVLELVAAANTAGMEPLVRVRAPVTLIDRGIKLVSAPMPRYPPSALARGTQGLVRLRFVVSETGRAERNSIRVLAANQPAFIPPSIEAIEQALFEPAQAGGCPVKALVEQNIRYTLGQR